MDEAGQFWYFSDMITISPPIPAWQLYGEAKPFPDVLHIERIVDRAAGLDWSIAPHRHVHLHQIFLLQSGQIKLALDGEAITVTPPAILNLPRDHVHGFSFSQGTEGYVLTLPAKDFPDLFGSGAEMAMPLARPFVAPATDSVAAQFEAMARQYHAPGPYRKTLLRAAVTTLMGKVLSAAPMDSTPPRATDRSDPRIAQFQAMVRTALRSRHRVEDFARGLAVSSRHLNRLCQTQIGLSAKAYIEAEKMREACRLLVYTRMAVQSVAFHLGYDDPAYFSRAFRRHIGLSPGAYRDRFDQ